METDGYVALNAYVPPKERRGLALIDPPYEAPDESERVEAALASARCQMAARDLRAVAADQGAARGRPLPQRDRARSARPISCGSNSTSAPVAPGAHSPNPLSRAGLLVVNPPFGLIDEARVLLPWLTQLLRRGAGGGFVCAWLTAPG